MKTDTRIVLATPNAGYEQRVRQAFDGTLNGELRRWRPQPEESDPRVALRELAAGSPDVVALGPGLSVESALELARQLERDRPEISVLLVAEPTPQLWEQALRAGVGDVLTPDAADADVRAAFDRALKVAARMRNNLVGGGEDSAPKGRIITVVSPKGGSGKTTVASNLSLALTAAAPGQVAIVDLDLQFGDVGGALRLSPEQTIVEAARAGESLDAMALKAMLTPHPSGLWALCAPDSPARGEEVTAEQAARIVRVLADEFLYVVVDTSAGLTEHTLSVLEHSTDLITLCAMDVPSVRSLRKEIDALELVGLTGHQRHFVLNRADAKVGLDVQDVEATVGMPVNVSLRSSRAVPLSMNQGSPVVESDPRSPVAKELHQLAKRFVEQPAGRGTGLLRWRPASR